MKKKQIFAGLLLLFATFIWGSAFVAQKEGSNVVGSFTFCFSRSLIASVGLAIAALLSGYLKKKKKNAGSENTVSRSDENQTLKKSDRIKHHLRVGVLCGMALCAASVCQQIGIASGEVTTAQSGFLTALYVILVPLAGLFLGQKMSWNLWLGCLLGLGGMYLLCFGNGSGFGSISRGSIYLLLCAVLFTVHILLLDRFSASCDSLWLSCIQFSTMTILCIPGMIAEAPTFSQIMDAALPILYAGLLSSGVAYTIQIYTQSILHPAVASVIMCFESVFALLCGWTILQESPSLSEAIGCLLVFIGILAAQFNPLTLFSKTAKK